MTLAVLVTGGAGFIGANLVRKLCQSGVDVCVLDDLSTGLRSNLDGVSGVEFVEGSITDFGVVQDSMQGASSVVHLAARGSVPRSIKAPRATHDVNATGTLNILMAAKDIGAHVIVASSSSVYGANGALPKSEDMWCQPLSPYGASKQAAESYALAFSTVYELPVLVLRFFNVYGQLQRPDHEYAAVIPRLASAALLGSPALIHGDGRQTRDFTHVSSVVNLLTTALSERTTNTRPVNVAFGVRRSILEVVDQLERLVGRPMEIEFGAARSGDVRDSENDPRNLLRLFPTVENVDLAEGLRQTLDWLGPELLPRPGAE